MVEKNNEILDMVKKTAASTATTLGREAGAIAVQTAIKSGALALAASKMSVKTATKVAGYSATSEARSEIKDLNKEIKLLNKTIDEKNLLIEQLRKEIDELKGI